MAVSIPLYQMGSTNDPDTTMNTVDPKEPYGDKPAERAPQEKIGQSGLTSKRIGELIIATGMSPEPLFSQREMVRRVIDGLITSGELRVVKKVSREQWRDGDCCGDSSGGATEWHGYPDFCPGCGAQIVK